MSAKPTIILNSRTARQKAAQWLAKAPDGVIVTFAKPKRTLDQNALLHAAITDIAQQVEWPLGSGQRRDVEAWKDILTAALRSSKNGLDVVPGINGGFVLLGMHTSQLSRDEMSELIELAYAFGAAHGVQFNDGQERAA